MPVDQLIGIGGFALVAAALGILGLPVGSCEQCPHCQEIERVKSAHQRYLQDQYAKRWGLKDPEDED